MASQNAHCKSSNLFDESNNLFDGYVHRTPDIKNLNNHGDWTKLLSGLYVSEKSIQT